MHEVREFAGHADIRTTEVYFVRKEEDAEVAARRIQIRRTGLEGPVKRCVTVPEILPTDARQATDRRFGRSHRRTQHRRLRPRRPERRPRQEALRLGYGPATRAGHLDPSRKWGAGRGASCH